MKIKVQNFNGRDFTKGKEEGGWVSYLLKNGQKQG